MSARLQHGEVEAVRVGRFPFRINTTCLVYRVGATVIDTGPPNQWPRVRRFLRERPVERVLLTHHHEDHSGNLLPAREELDGPALLAPRAALGALADGFPMRAYQLVVWGRPRRLRAEPLPGRIPLDARGGRVLEAIPTPGHSPDSTAFLEVARGWLFSGDLYVASRPRYLREDEDVGETIASLRRVLERDFDTVFCAHRGVVGRAALRLKLDHLVELCGAVRDLRLAGCGEREITRRLLGREDAQSALTGFHFSKRNLVRSCLRAGVAAAQREPGGGADDGEES